MSSPPQKKSFKRKAKRDFSQVFLPLCYYLYYYNVLPLLGCVKRTAKGLEDSRVQNAIARAGWAGLAPLPTAAPRAARSWLGASPALRSDRQVSASVIPSGRLERPNSAGFSDRGPARTAEPICRGGRGRALL